MTINEAAKLLKVHPITIRRKIARRELQGFKYTKGPRGHWRLKEQDVRKLLKRGN